ncbi:DUF4445 domain-containing protein [candidate division KSB1 bacterium]|nr:DUF4445 domain-containing protein [candidate division KSB1 bacterium]
MLWNDTRAHQGDGEAVRVNEFVIGLGHILTDTEKIAVVFKPSEAIASVKKGLSLLDAAEQAGIMLPAVCGGKGKCGKCKVRILNSKVPFSHHEEISLTDKEKAENMHLACQVYVEEGIELEIPDAINDEHVKFLTEEIVNEFEIDDHLKKVYVEIEPADISNPIDDLTQLKSQLFDDPENVSFSISLFMLQNLSTFLRKNNYKITFVLSNNRLINLEPGNTTERIYGLAFDLGTTTIAGTLVDMKTGKNLAISSRTNPQSIHGADVISRVNYSSNEPGGLSKLQKMVVEKINEIIEELTEKANVSFREIYEMTLAGNTIMNHIFLGANPQYIGESPYIPTFLEPQTFTAEELGLTLLPNMPVMILPNISGYVGGDISAFILAAKLHKADKITLGIDIGTNGEIVLGSKNELVCCSSAAGPAFEGGHISCGMRAMTGAIDKIIFDENGIFYNTIGNAEPKGICGTGLIDLLAELIKYEIIDSSGKFKKAVECKGEWYQDRIIENDSGTGFIAVPVSDSAGDEAIIITQKDIRELQLAKAAMSAGIKILLNEMQLTEEHIEEVLIAGAFGSYINKYNAKLIGLIPDNIPVDRINFVGNAASSGAKKYLLSENARQEVREIIHFTKYIELSKREDFQKEFTEAMFF